MKEIAFSSMQDPRSWDPSADFDAATVITCATNGDAKKAEEIFNALLVRAEKAEAALANRPEVEFREIGYLLKNEYGFVSAHVPNLDRDTVIGQTPIYRREPQSSEDK